jgi:cellulose biosynthesis protein BcsQ
MGKIASIGNSKGGVGKSTITAVVATFINKKTDLSICVVDADVNQRTLARWRRDDLIKSGVDRHEANELYERFALDKVDYAKYGLQREDYFDLLIADPKHLPQLLAILKERYDLIFIDLPGNIGQEGVLTCYGFVEYLFVPTGLYVADTDATFTKYLPGITVELKNTRGLAGLEDTKVYIFINRVNKSTIEYKSFIKNRDSMDYDFLNTVVPDSKATFGREISTSEIIEFKSQGENVVHSLCEEIMDKMNLNVLTN